MWRLAALASAILFLSFLLRCSGVTPEQRACTSNCEPSDRGYNVTSYELVGRFDWSNKRLVATERVILVRASIVVTAIEFDADVSVRQVRGAAGGDGDGGPSGAREDDGGTNSEGIELPYALTSAQRLLIDVSPLGSDAKTLSLTIEYEASPSDALIASTSRDDDPVTSRVVYTDSEPFGGMYWLPANHRPSDRAAFRVELMVEANEDVIANGARIKDEMRGGQRVVRYEMDQPIPTYTMAFAAGELEHRERTTGRVPIGVWFRRGLALDADAMLDLLSGAMGSFENLLGPYPWDRYAVVLLPEYSGGMENTTITFTAETSGQANPGLSLQAHELGHQWFGDWVTVATFDDVWIKEGMATLLAPEADRARRDANGAGRLFGYNFGFSAADAIRDRSLVGLAKYTSGPYQRAAWLLGQIRARVGEASFWQSLRRVLAEHALGSIDSETFVRSFALDEGTVQKVLHALDDKRVPAVTIQTQPGPTTMITLSLTDPGGTMFAPTAVTVVDGQGRPATSTLAPDVPVNVAVPSGGYLALDEPDVHPPWWVSFDVRSDEFSALVPLLFPSSDAARATFTARSAAHQERAFDALLGFAAKLDVPSSAFATLYADLDSTLARRFAEIGGCIALGSHTDDAWSGVFGPILSNPSLTTSSTGYGNCQTDLSTRLFGAEIASLATNVDAQGASRLVYLSSYDYGPAATLDALAPVAARAPSLQLRDQAITRLTYQAVAGSGYSPIGASDAPRWKDFFRARLTDAKSATRFRMVWRAVTGLGDDGALAIAGQRLHSVPLSDDDQRQVICDAYAIAKASRPEAWTEFQQAAQPWDTLGSTAQQVLAQNGASCGP